MESYLKSFNLLSEQEIAAILAAGKLKKIKKNDFLIKEGQVCKEIIFVKSGFFRTFYYSPSGEEITYCFTFANAFTTAYSSFINQEKTVENIHALLDAEVVTISRDKILKLEQSSVNWLRFTKMMAEQEYLKMEKRVFLLLKENAEHKYNSLLASHPEYLQHIPLSHLASYLGITQRHLSRIRKSVTI